MNIATKQRRRTVIIFIVLLSVVGLVIRIHYYDQQLGAILAPCMRVSRLNPNAVLPCYQEAMRYDPYNQYLQISAAAILVHLGRFEEARSIYQRAAGEIGLQTNEAKQMLEPGAMQRQKTANDQLLEANKEYVALCHEHARIAMAFQATHPTDEEPYKSQMRAMVELHVREEREMMIAKGVWKPFVLQQPYYMTPRY